MLLIMALGVTYLIGCSFGFVTKNLNSSEDLCDPGDGDNCIGMSIFAKYDFQNRTAPE